MIIIINIICYKKNMKLKNDHRSKFPTESAYEMINQAIKKHAYLKRLSKQRRMVFFFLRYLFSSQR